MIEPIENRFDFVFFFDVENGNPNGDPDAGNMPRIDPETSIGIVSDVCLKRKVRNYVSLVKSQSIDDPDTAEGELGYKIYVEEKAVLNDRNQKAYVHYDLESNSKKLPKKEGDQLKVTKFMTDNFFDIRAFGAVMTTDVNCGQVRGPIQICFAQSVDPIVPQELSITRMAVTNAKDAEKERTMGRKQYVPYGLYRAEGFISASLAEKTGFCDADLNLFWEALMNMFENDRSAARGLMTSRKLAVFKHESKIGNASARSLFDTVSVTRTGEGVPRSYSDYKIEIDATGIPEGIETKVFDSLQPSI